MFLDWHNIADTCVTALQEHERGLCEEQAVYGIDAIKETQLHPLLALGASQAQLGSFQETPYPSSGTPHATKTSRTRCDLVITRRPQQRVKDPVEQAREQALVSETLFAQIDESRTLLDDDCCEPEDAVWIEVKSVAQYACRDGVYVPNSSYAHELVHGLCSDVAKLALDERIWHAGVMLVVFTETEQAAEQDIATAVARAASEQLPVRTPIIRSFPITDRGGNSCASVAIVPVAC